MSVIFYNDTASTCMFTVYPNDDPDKLAHQVTPDDVAPGGATVQPLENVQFSPLQVVVRVQEGDEEDLGFLVTDLVQVGGVGPRGKAWVYIGGGPGAWDFRVGRGYKYRVKRSRGIVYGRWLDADTGAKITGRGDGKAPSDMWPPTRIKPIKGQPPVTAIDPAPPGVIDEWVDPDPPRAAGRYRHVLAGRNGTVYRIDRQGSLYRYHHLDFEGGSKQWSGPASIGVPGARWGQRRFVAASNEGVLYRVSPGGALLWHRDLDHAGGDAGWSHGAGLQLGKGWEHHQQLMAGDDGVLYAISDMGDLLWFRHAAHGTVEATGEAGWLNGGQGVVVARGWRDKSWAGVSTGGVIYTREFDGTLVFHKHLGYLDGSANWGPEARVGEGWGSIAGITASNDGVLYTVDDAGNLSWFRNTDGAGGTWRQALAIGTGWVP